ncbi:hypothetical protein [Flavobacterium sp. JP2137]|uniref:hypothetical protein n=1 Tax=Flavobacterium sp. JP2137 TaxID=3414510 RepID=UPI003D2FCDA1
MEALKKYGLFTVIYLILTAVMADDFACLWAVDGLCWAKFLGKYAIFMLLMLVYDRFFKNKIFGKKQ